MTQKPTGVYVRLPLPEYLREAFVTAIDCGEEAEQAILAAGTPVTVTELYPIGYINEDAIRGLATGVYQSASLFRDEGKEHYDTVALVRLSDAQAQLAARDAEIARLLEIITAAQTSISRGSPMKAAYALDEALKGGAA
ncbi:hypothetical protein [Acetobacter cibinongensis]|nr:hypothetical protein [Acetobacter cibinongensis]